MAKEAMVIIWDIGKNSYEHAELDSNSYYNKSKSCISQILQRKIFSKPKDEIGLLLMGTDSTNNYLNRTIGGYDHIAEAFDMAITNWEMLRIIEYQIKPERKIADWLDALIVAMDFLRRSSENRKYSSLKIVICTTFSTFVNGDNVEVVIRGLKNMNIELIAIADNLIYKEIDEDDEQYEENIPMTFSQNRNVSDVQRESENLIEKIIDETDGILCGFQDAITKLIYFPKKKVRGTPWNATLSIGSDIKLNISSYIYITDDKSIPSWKTESALPNTISKRTMQYFKGDERIETDFETLIKGYMYGDSIIPIDYDINSDINTFASLMCIGFIEKNDLSPDLFMGSGTNVVVGNKTCLGSQEILSILIKAMIETEMVMIVRRVYRKGTQPKLYALIPKLHENIHLCLSMIELPMSNNMTEWIFPSLTNKKYEPSMEQYDAVDKLIDSMDLMSAHEDETGGMREAFAFKKTLNPSNQYIYRCITQRATNPTASIPPPDQELLDMLDIPKIIKENSKSNFEKIKEVFPLEVIEKVTAIHKAQIALQSKDDGDGASTSINQSDLDTRKIVEIGTITPMDDFIYLLERGESLIKLCKQMQNIISDLLFKSIVYQKDKLLETIKIYRRETAIMGSLSYNDWIREFKKIVISKGKKDFWNEVIVNEKLGLQTTSENDSVVVNDEEAEKFYKIDDSLEEIANNEMDDIDVDDLFDNM